MRWRYRWAVLLVPLLAACVNSGAPAPTVTVTPTVAIVISPIATITSISVPASTTSPNPLPTGRIVDPLIQDFISQLNERGFETRLMARTVSHVNCLSTEDSVLYGYIAGAGVKFGYGEVFDLWHFGSEQSANTIANRVQQRGCSTPDWSYELPFFQCGAVIAFANNPDTALQTAFEELCGRPFAWTSAWSVFGTDHQINADEGIYEVAK